MAKYEFTADYDIGDLVFIDGGSCIMICRITDVNFNLSNRGTKTDRDATGEVTYVGVTKIGRGTYDLKPCEILGKLTECDEKCIDLIRRYILADYSEELA